MGGIICIIDRKQKPFPCYAIEVSPLTLSSIRQTGRINHVPHKEGNFTSFFTLPTIYKYQTITSIVSRLHLKWVDRLQ